MKSLKDRVREIGDDPEKIKTTFNVAWILSYAMLIFGFAIILVVLILSL